MTATKVTILGMNGHFGRHAAQAFAAAGHDVTGFGRTNRHPVPGVRFVAGDAERVEDMRAAIGDSEIVVNALNLPYDKWDKGRYEALTARVVAAMGNSGRTMIFPGNIYNYCFTERLVTPATAQEPPTPRGAIRMRVEEMLKQATASGGLKVVIVRAGDFFGPDCREDWFDQVILREAAKGRLATLGARGVGHAWAYLPDLARAFVAVAGERQGFGPLETFHFGGYFVTPEEMAAAIAGASPVPLKVTAFPWLILSLLGLTNPVMREVSKMGYLWQHPMELRDDRLAGILGPDFGTSFADAVAATVDHAFAPLRAAG